MTVMPAVPLVLEEIGYSPEEQWVARQRETRSLAPLD